MVCQLSALRTCIIAADAGIVERRQPENRMNEKKKKKQPNPNQYEIEERKYAYRQSQSIARNINNGEKYADISSV